MNVQPGLEELSLTSNKRARLDRILRKTSATAPPSS